MKLEKLLHFMLILVTLGLIACEESNPSKVDDIDKSSSSSSEDLSDVSSSSQEEILCGFLVSDTVWSYSVKTSDGKDEGSIKVTYKINDKNLVRIEKAIVSGSTSSLVCRLMSGSENVTDFFGDSTYIKKSICDGSEMISTSTIINENFFESTLVEDFHVSILNSCKIANKLISAPKASTEKMMTNCDFKLEDNLWEYSYGDSSSYTLKRYLFDGDDVTSISLNITAMDYAECLAITPSSQSLRYCEERGLLERSSSGFTIEEDDRDGFFNSTYDNCIENVPVSNEE